MPSAYLLHDRISGQSSFDRFRPTQTLSPAVSARLQIRLDQEFGNRGQGQLTTVKVIVCPAVE